MEDWGITRVVKHYDLDRVRLGAERSARASPRVGRGIHDLDAARLTDAVTGRTPEPDRLPSITPRKTVMTTTALWLGINPAECLKDSDTRQRSSSGSNAPTTAAAGNAASDD